MKHKFDICETVARAFPGADRAQADRYTVVEKETDQASLVPGLSEGNVAAQDKLVTER